MKTRRRLLLGPALPAAPAALVATATRFRWFCRTIWLFVFVLLTGAAGGASAGAPPSDDMMPSGLMTAKFE